MPLLLTFAALGVLPPSNGALAAGEAAPRDVCDRGCWGARPPRCAIGQEPTIDRAVIHHTAAQTDMDSTSLDDSAARVRAHQNFHMDVNGWCDIGYHFLIDRFGNAFEGREGSLYSYPHGAHDSVNTRSFGFSLMGYFHPPYNQQPPDEMRAAAYDLISWLVPDPFTGYGSGTYGGRTVGFVAGHRNVIATACPGDIMYANIGDDFFGGEARTEIHTRITGGPVALPRNVAAEAPIARERREGESRTAYVALRFEHGLKSSGALESKPLALDFPSNAWVLLWRMSPATANTRSGELSAEIALSADGKSWGRWMSISAGDLADAGDIAPKLAGGAPNPSFGFIAGELVTTGTTQWRFVRYRIVRSADGAEAPLIDAARIYYQDTTLGSGRLADTSSSY